MAKRSRRRVASVAKKTVKRAAKGRAAKRRGLQKASAKPKTKAKATVKGKIATKPGAKNKASPRVVRKVAQRPPIRRVASPRAKNHAVRLDRVRRTLEHSVQSPPSSLDMDRHGSSVRTGRAEMAERRLDHRTMTPSIAGGEVDTNIESAYFSGDGAPGGDNPTPDQDIVDDIGRALGVEYQDNEELRSGDKIVERDKHRWELDPASAEDYRDRKGDDRKT